MAEVYICENPECEEHKKNVAYENQKNCEKCGSRRSPVMLKLKEIERSRFSRGLKIQESEIER